MPQQSAEPVITMKIGRSSLSGKGSPYLGSSTIVRVALVAALGLGDHKGRPYATRTQLRFHPHTWPNGP